MHLATYFILFSLAHRIAALSILKNPLQVAKKEYDFIIVGGGLTGLTAAARLTKNKDITVLVIESGFFQSTRGPIVESVTGFGQGFGTSLDHSFQTVSLDINGRPLIIHSGNGLGGSTLINGASYTSPAKIQIDSWESHLGNRGWNWKNLSSYIREMEHAHHPSRKQIEAGHFFDPHCHGDNGAIHVSVRDDGSQYSPIIPSFMKMMARHGVSTQKDLSCGDPRGVSMFLNTIHENQTRSDAARELLLPIIDRQNLWILVGQRVGKVLIDEKSSSYRAKGVDFGTDGEQFEVFAKHEVILAAGALVSPLILEYSGIGVKSILETAKVDQIIDLPVGQNLQDQTTTALSTLIHSRGGGQGQAIYFATWNEIFKGSSLTTARGLLDSQLDQWARDAVSNGGFGNTTALKVQMEMYRDWVLKHNVAYAEIFMDVSPKSLGYSAWILLPFTRGYIHILDSDPYLWKVALNPRYLENDLDRYAQAAASQLVRNLTKDSSIRHYIQEERFPGSTVPQNATVDDWVSHVTRNFQPNYHAIGTCSMMAKELGGVVDPFGRVYGIPNLRIIDASIVPTQVSAHTSALLYGMAVKLSDFILADYSESHSVQKD
ncbi:glucose oxidase [Penicillium malachiteum]|uniref:glucose oxidase n=1 Tax=Penicillium malachiteum TaxID=1324776 RepID=UPI002548D9CA|nr:glucose oxidase [Penicillium malachiteum]KAJ5729526.1 glucose oxidase [Penicillium malachiteum]